jgi:hypothetical protein
LAVFGQRDVRRLQIAMDDAFLVRSFERLRDLLADAERLIDRNRSVCDPLVETLPVDQFEHEELRPVRFFQSMNLRCADG